MHQYFRIRSFKDSDDDGIGDLNGITSRLEYLKEIGIDGVWLSPIFKVIYDSYKILQNVRKYK